jgi:hypothetical protein
MKIVETPEHPRRRRDENLDWWVRAPRWLLRSVVVVLMVALGYLIAQVQTYQSAESARIQAALLDAPTKYQIRISERLADVEGRQSAHEKSDDALAKQLGQTNEAVTALAVQVGRLAVEISHLRGERNAQR